MGYSAQTQNAADRLDDSYSLLGFAYNRTRTFIRNPSNPIFPPDDMLEDVVRGVFSPIVFMYYLAAGPIAYKVNDKDVYDPNKKLGDGIKSVTSHPTEKVKSVVRLGDDKAAIVINGDAMKRLKGLEGRLN